MSSSTTPNGTPSLDGFAVYLAGIRTSRGRPLSPHTQRNYRSRVAAYLDWLADCDPTQWHGDPLTTTGPAQLAADAYRSHLLTVQKKSHETVNAHLTALDAYYRWRGLPQVVAPGARIDIPTRAPESLTSTEIKRLLNYVDLLACAEATGQPVPCLDQALVYVAYYAGLRVDELAALDIEDMPMTARAGQIEVRAGKGGKPRSIPIASELRPVLDRWRAHRLHQHGDAPSPIPAWVGERGRLGTSGLRRRIARIGAQVGLTLTPHTLRHSYGTRLVRSGVDLATVAQLMGHARTETTRRYAAPSRDDMAAAVDVLSVADIPAAPR